MEAVEVSVPNDALFRELDAHNAFFDGLVDMLPKLYVSGPTGDEKYNPRYRRGQHAESKEARRARNKAARLAKFDPARAETTLQAKKRMEREAELSGCGGADGGGGDDPGGAGPGPGGGAPPPPAPAFAGSGASRIEALRARLRAKIAERRSRPGEAGTPEVVSKRAARRAEKRRRKEEAKRRGEHRGGGGGTDAGREAGRKVRFMGGTCLNAAGAGDSADPAEDLAGVDYGTIAGLNQTPHHIDNKALAGGKKSKSLDRLLAEAEKKAERLKELKASSSQKDKKKAQNIEWGDTLRAATGERSRDKNPDMIKKEIKRRAKKKAKSAEAWKARMKQTKEKMDERQKVRSHNLDKRKLGGAVGANLSRKRIVTEETEEDKEGKKKRPRLGPHSGKGRAGFEGKKQEFINGKQAGKKGGGKKAKTSPQ